MLTHQAVELSQGGEAEGRAQTQRCLCHLARAAATRAAQEDSGRGLPPHSQTVLALRCAERAREIAASSANGIDAATLTNLAVAMLMAHRATVEASVDLPEAATAARVLLEEAVGICTKKIAVS